MKRRLLRSFRVRVVRVGAAIGIILAALLVLNVLGAFNSSAYRCARIKERGGFSIYGYLLLESRSEETPSLALGAADVYELNGLTPYSAIGPSPGGRLLYYDYLTDTRVVVDAGGERKTLAWGEFISPIVWLTDDRLLSYDERDLSALWIIGVDGGTGKAVNLATFSNRDQIEWTKWGAYGRFGIVPNRDLTRLVYVADDEPGTPLVLWDIVSRREITRVHWSLSYDVPQWAPDGRSFVTAAPPVYVYQGRTYINVATDPGDYVGGADLIQAFDTGAVHRLTFYSSDANAVPTAFAWSPDGKFGAFALTLQGEKRDEKRFSTIDLMTGEIVNYCLPRSRGAVVSRPVWSPDGKFVAVSLRADGKATVTYVVEAKTGEWFKVWEGGAAIGWIAER